LPPRLPRSTLFPYTTLFRSAVANLKKHYIDPVVAQKMADALVGHEKKGDDNAATDGRAFAELLTQQMRDVSHDRHLELLYSEARSEEHTSELQSLRHLVCRL